MSTKAPASKVSTPAIPIKDDFIFIRSMFDYSVLQFTLCSLIPLHFSTRVISILVSSRDNFSFYPNISFTRVPFVAGHAERLSGAYESSAPVDVYLLNSTQFLSFDSGGGNCQLTSGTPLMINGTGVSISSDVVGSGSYSLIFCAPYQFNGPKIQVTITN